MNVPNLLSLFRIILVPIFVITFFAVPENGILSASILMISGITDFLDGFIARKFHLITQLGKILDPLADKLTQLSVCVCLAIRHKEFIIILCLLIAKEIIMLIAGFVLLKKGHRLPSSRWFGKVSTVVFYLVMIYVVCNVAISNFQLAILVWIMVGFAVLAFILYIPEFFKLKQKKTNGEMTCAEILKSSVEQIKTE
jgi:cardiolipin synthase